jgi:hypothetical protein
MLINYFLFMVTLLAFAGLAIDVGMMQWRSLRVQHAADAAAQEAMYQYFRGDTSWSSEGQAQATMNGFSNGVNGATVSLLYPPTSGPLTGDTLSIQANVTQTFNTLFMGLLKGGSSSVTATATAREIPTCVWIMNPSSPSNGSLALASASMSPNCGVYVNTASGYTLGVDGFANLYSLRNRVVGVASTASISTGGIGPQPKYGAAVKKDPLAYVTAPTLTTCTYTSVSYSSGSHTLSPGSYCGGITLSSTTITLNAGLYMIDGGMNVSNSNIYGTGVTLYFTKKSASPSYTTVKFNSSNSSTYGIYLKAPTVSSGGAIKGVVMFADRNWVSHGSQGIQIVGYTITGDGYWYLLNTGLYLWACPFTYSTYNGLVIDNIYQFGASSHFASDFSQLGGSPLHYEDGVLEQ